MDRLYMDLPGGLSLDLRGMTHLLDSLPTQALHGALEEMGVLERGGIANPDENRRVGHYWLRAPERAPDDAIKEDIVESQRACIELAAGLDEGIRDVLLVGIGGSALGPQLIAEALSPSPSMRRLHLMDNTDPDGMAGVLSRLAPRETLVLVVSKSGSTAETVNGLTLTDHFYREAGVELAPHCVAITSPGSSLGRRAMTEGWRAILPVWDWVGGRTSVTSAVGLAPGHLLGIPMDELLEGAAAMDEFTRAPDPIANPAALLAAAWHSANNPHQSRSMVVLPYRDRLALLGRYLQQLIMESVGKSHTRSGAPIHHGLAVFGHKGSTDQHALAQQLRDGPDDTFVTFIEVLSEPSKDPEVSPGVTAGDVLSGFLAGTRHALNQAGRRSMTLTLDRLSPTSVGAMVALFERAVGLYASLLDINAYHQPGVEAGKKVATETLEIQGRLLAALREGHQGDAAQLAEHVGATEEQAFHILRRLAATDRARETGSGLGRCFAASEPP